MSWMHVSQLPDWSEYFKTELARIYFGKKKIKKQKGKKKLGYCELFSGRHIILLLGTWKYPCLAR